MKIRVISEEIDVFAAVLEAFWLFLADLLSVLCVACPSSSMLDA